MTTIVQSRPETRNPLPSGQLPYANQFDQHQSMVNAINHHHQHNQRLHQQQQQEMQLMHLQQQQQLQREQQHYASASQAKYVDEHEEEVGEDDLAGPSVCVHIVMKVKPEWIHEVKFLIQRIKKWAEAHEPGLLTFRATVAVDNPCEIRLFQEYANMDAYRVHETNPFMQEMVNGLADYLEEDMEFFQTKEFAL